MAEELALDTAEWSVERADTPRRQATGPGGSTATVVDHVLVLTEETARDAGHADILRELTDGTTGR